MRRATDFGGYRVLEDAPLAALNTLRVPGHARWRIDVTDAQRLPEVLRLPAIRSGPVLTLGQGSNVLFTGDWPGTVLRLDTRGIEAGADGAATTLRVAAGENWDGLVRWCLAHGHHGLENLVLIPGTVGAAPVQNIGAYGREIASFVTAVEAWDRQREACVTLDHAACRFRYRDSIFKHQPDRWLITHVRLRLPHATPLELGYAGIRSELEALGAETPTPSLVAEAVVRLRTRKLPDPAEIGNAGSFFKNPVLAAPAAARVLAAHGDAAHWPLPGGEVKFSAAWLIDRCELKGLREGPAGISSRHALVLVNHGGASGAQLWSFARRVIATVEARFGITLEPEPRVLHPH